MSKLACMLTLRHEVATWSDKILNDAVEFAKTYRSIFVERKSGCGKESVVRSHESCRQYP